MTQSADMPDAIAQLSQMADWEDRYRYILALGQTLAPLADSEKTPANLVHGCVSKVWLVPQVEMSGGQLRLWFCGESDAMIVQGLMALLFTLYAGRTAPEIAAIDAGAVFDQLGLRRHFTSQRANGLFAMNHRIQTEAQAHLARSC